VAGDPAAPAILGDVHEEFVVRARKRGIWRARVWYRREVILLVFGRWWHDLLSAFRWKGRVMKGLRSGEIRHDFTSAMRTVRRSPALHVLLALVIGLGVGATTAVYSVVSPLLSRPLPFGDPGSLVWIENTAGGSSLSSVTSRTSNLRDFRELATSFDGLTGYMAFFDQTSYTMGAAGSPEQTTGVGVAHDFLDVLGLEPMLGRTFTVEEGQWGGPRAILLTHGFWGRTFAGDPKVVGTSVSINGEPYEVAGVLGPEFDFTSIFTPAVRVDFLLPFPISDETDRWGNTMFFIGRLRPGATVDVAQRDLERVIAGLEEEQPERWGLGARVMPLQEHVAGPFRPALLLLILAGTAVMLIVCVNVANILLARSPRRGREVAVRKALGATRAAIVRQLLAESVLLSGAAAVVGVMVALLITRFVSGMTGMSIPMLDRVAIDGRALLFALVAATGAGLLAGIVPALQVAEGRESETLRAVSRGASGSRAGRRLREGLVIAELALACALLVAGGLLLQSFRAVLAVDLGFDTSNAVAWQLNPSHDFETLSEATAFYSDLTSRLRDLQGVENVGLIDALPLGKNRGWGYQVVGAPETDEPNPGFFPHIIGPGYIETMRISLQAGRNITAMDTEQTQPVILINETAAARMFPGEDPLGRLVLVGGGGGTPWQVAGVVADIHHVTPESDAGLQVYFPMAQIWAFSTLDLVVRSRLPAATVAASVRSTLAQIDPAMPTRDYWTLDPTVDRSLSARRFTLEILGGFGLVALLLAALGIYGVLAQSVAERTREIGIRMTLGATAGSVRLGVVGRTLLLATAGIAIGLAIALTGSRLLESLLYGVPAADPATLASMAGILLGTAVMSGLLPALRASRTEALSVLKGE
jgi:putative ABC transport system permease protein